jgi:hypothetical protein
MKAETAVHPLKGRRVKLVVAEPWEFGTVMGDQPIRCQIFDVDPDKSPRYALLEVTNPYEYRGLEYRRLLATPRHEGVALEDLLDSTPVTCQVARVPEGIDGGAAFVWKREWFDDVGLIATMMLEGDQGKHP